MMCIKQVLCDEDRLSIHYNMLEVTAAQIETVIEQFGTDLASIWKDRLKWSVVHYLEETGLENLEKQHERHGCHH